MLLSANPKEFKMCLFGAWRTRPDFEELIVNNLNSLFAPENLEQITAVGEAMARDGISTAAAIDGAILRHFNWSPGSWNPA